MVALDRGHKFSGYYLADKDNPFTVFGTTWENQFHCGSLNNRSVYFIVFYSTQLNDTNGHNESIDFDLDNADLLPFIQMSDCVPSVQALILQDMKDGLSVDDVLLKRAGVMAPQFLGFKRDDIAGYKENEVVDDEGNKHLIPNVRRCSLEL